MESTSSLQKTDRSQVKRAKNRASYNKDDAYTLIDSTKLGHVAFIDHQHPVVIPMLCWRVDNNLYIHGARISRIISTLGQGIQISVSFAVLDAWVMAKSAFHHSANYRSLVLFGQPEAVLDEHEQLTAYEAFIDQLQTGRWQDIRQPNQKELNATGLIKLEINEGAYKSRSGPPNDDKEDENLSVWSGLIPIDYNTP